MRHRKRSRRLSRQKGHRRATINNLVRNLFIHQRIETTLAKAKVAKKAADELITLGKRGSLQSRRRACEILGDRELASSLFKDLAPLFKQRRGGYTRIMRTRERPGDNASLAILELVEQKKKEVSKPKPVKGKALPAKEKPVPLSQETGAEEKPRPAKEKPRREEKPKAPRIKTRPEEKKPRKFLRDLRGFFRKERDAL